MDPKSQQKIIRGHGHLISSSSFPNHVSNPTGSPSVEDSGPPSPSSGPIINFAEVSPGIYRSSFPRSGNFEHMKSLGLKSILTLVPEVYPPENVNFMSENGIQHFQIPIPAHKEPSVIIPPQNIIEALKIMLDPINHPLLIHCNKGKHRTGCIVACYRKIHYWTIEAILTEYRKYASTKFRPLDEAFIERFDERNALAALKVCQEIVLPGSPLPLLPSPKLLTPPASVKDDKLDE